MSYSFEASFSPTVLDLAQIIERLEPCLSESGVELDGEIARLHSRDGVPTVLSLDTVSVSALHDVVRHARSWWGVAFYCVSRPLADELGRDTAIEVYLQIFKTGLGGQRMLVYTEASGAFRARAASDTLTNDLAALLMRICGALELEVAIYAEEGEGLEVPTVARLEQLLDEQSRSRQALGWLAVVADRSLAFTRARELAGPWGDRIRISVTGYVVLPFLAGTLDDA